MIAQAIVTATLMLNVRMTISTLLLEVNSCCNVLKPSSYLICPEKSSML